MSWPIFFAPSLVKAEDFAKYVDSLNGDGRDDYVYVDNNGDVYGWINRLQNSDGVWQWQGLGKIAGGVGATNDTLQMVDVDGKIDLVSFGSMATNHG